MKTKYTFGEWFAKDGQIYPTETGKTIAVIPYFDEENEEQRGNAQLIAAAPDLLYALTLIINKFDSVKKVIDADLGNELNIAISAVQKAERGI